MSDFSGIDVRNPTNVRKGLRAAIFVAPMTAPAITEITDTNGNLKTIPTAYRSLGWNSEDGVTWARETEVSDVYGHGSPEPIRSDIRRSTKRMSVTCLETNIVVLEQYLGFSLAAVDTATGLEGTWDEPELPGFNYVRLLAIAKDVGDTGEYYMGKHFLRCRVTETGEETWQDQDTPLQYALTFTAFQDADEGTALRHFLGGPARVPDDEGFPGENS